jgi:2-oxoglutarate ferredoxin oxidoreductase subunit alpha
MVDLIGLAFDKAEEYRNPVMILSDAIMGQMMEPVALPAMRTETTEKPWATTGKQGRSKPNIINSLGLVGEDLERINIELQAKYARLAAAEVRYETDGTGEADLIVVAYGTSSRVVRSAINRLRQEGKKVGLFRPITLWPFPKEALASLAAEGKRFLVVEMSAGQLVEDVILAVNDRAKVSFFGKLNGTVPTVREVYDRILSSLPEGGEG